MSTFSFRYLALEAVSKFSNTPYADTLIQNHLKPILASLRDNDISIRRRALDILYVLCTAQTSSVIVKELLNYSTEPDIDVKEELVLKIAILAEKFAESLTWYVDTVIKLVSDSGDYITDDIWHRILQMVTGFGEQQNEELQRYAADRIFTALSVSAVHENLVKIGSYVLSEYGHLIANQPGKDPQKLFDILQKHWVSCSSPARCMVLNAYVKLATRFPVLLDQVVAFMEQFREHWDPDLQQRALEYIDLLKEEDETREARNHCLQPMPTYSEDIQQNNPLIRKIYALKMGANTDDATVANENKKLALEEIMKTQALSKAEFTTGKSGSPGLGSEYTEATILSTSPALKHPCAELTSPGRLAEGGNIIKTTGPMRSNADNASELKNLVINSEGSLYTSNDIQIEYRSDYQGFLGRLLLRVTGKGDLSDVEVRVQDTENFAFKVSPAQFKDGTTQVMIQCINSGVGGRIPLAKMKYTLRGDTNIIDFVLPVSVNKFFESVDMPNEIFEKFYTEYTQSDNPNYYRIDDFIKSPAPPQVPAIEVMKKVYGLLGTGIGLGVSVVSNGLVVNAVGKYCFKDEDSQDMKTLPLMAQIEGFDKVIEDKKFLRISIRGAANKEVLKALHEIITLYLAA